MIQLKLIAALVVVLSAIVVGAVTDNGLWRISYPLQQAMAGMPSDDQDNPEKAYSFAENYLHSRFDARLVNELSLAWKRVLRQPDQCDGSSLGSIATIAQVAPQYSSPMRTLAEATKNYARKCLTQGLIKQTIDAALGKDSAELDSETSEFKLIDDIVSDYLSRHPGDIGFLDITRYASGLSIETRFCDRTTLNKNDFCGAYMQRRLYTPCSQLQDALTDVIAEISSASNFFEKGYENLFASLDSTTQKVFLRFKFCYVIPSWRGLSYQRVTPSPGLLVNKNVTPSPRPLNNKNNKSWFLRCFSE